MPTDVQFLDSRARVHADGDATAGHLGLVEILDMPAGSMPPLHVHHANDEGFYVLDGSARLFQPGTEVALEAGEFLLARRGIPHTYRVGGAGARVLVASSPAGFERFVLAVAEIAEPTPERLAAVAAEYDIEILGPPGMLPS
jgi:mannose-6-phosphate isomerase-like protein (cupin superfamily)